MRNRWKVLKSKETNAPKDKQLSDNVIDKTVGDERIGVPECDELLGFFDEQTKTRGVNYIIQEMAKNCRDY